MGVLFIFYLFFFFLFISFFSYGLIIIWFFFLLITMFFSFLIRFYGVSLLVVYNYVVFQEVLGILFLFSFFHWFLSFILLFKLGAPPFHFWVFLIVENLIGFVFVWFLVYHKLIFLPVISLIFRDFLSFVLVLGLIIIYIQMFFLSSVKSIFVLLSIESFSWLVLNLSLSLLSFYYFSFIYFISVMLVSFNMTFVSFLDFPMFFFLLRSPLSLRFFIKYSSIEFLLFNGVLFYVVVVMIFFSLITVLYLGFLIMMVFNIRFSGYSYIFFLVFMVVVLVIY